MVAVVEERAFGLMGIFKGSGGIERCGIYRGSGSAESVHAGAVV